MELTRREALALGACGVAATMLPAGAAFASAADDAIKEFTGGAAVKDGGVTITAPEIAENGNTVPIGIEAPGAVEVLVLAPANPTPKVCTFKFGPASGGPSASTRCRLAKTQDVTAVAKLADGSFTQTKTTVKVTIGGCGG